MDALFEFYPAKLLSDKAPCGLISIPHSGLKIPSEYRNAFIKDHFELDCDVDLAVDQLLDIPKIQEVGIHIIKYNFHRVFVDLNRSREEAVQNWEENTRGTPLIEKKLSTKEILPKYWDPYFFIIEQFISNTPIPFPIVDLHSMPSKPTEFHLKKNPNQANERPSFCLSDYHGESCPKAYIELALQRLQKYWNDSRVNDPYFGGYITQHFKTFENPNIQIEINRSLYMNEKKQEFDASKISVFKDQLTDSLVQLFTIWSEAKNDSV